MLNMISQANENVCYKCNRFIVKDYPKYNHSICKDIKEIVSLDCGLCESLEVVPNNREINDILYDKLSENEQYVYVSYDFTTPKEIEENFEFVGYDIVDNSISLITNISDKTLCKILKMEDMSNFGLILNYNKAIKVLDYIVNNLKECSHYEQPKIVLIYRYIAKGK